ncbi:uncharacterized protein LOC116295615 [Actinia tenebrosa]|uniref:Uncharacterized protein LOC116295615 n=1 Tax=Actinia tenebrosa TaxID=6105 RepID=A0A6P8HVF0_ACTTE|nr:uncharacterized protein LOC116295615 [Actinia tenebrosa]
MKITVCPLHRDLYGVRWRCNKTKCSVPDELVAHKSSTVKAQCGLTSLLSCFISNETKTLIPVGTAICKTCKSYLADLATEWKKNIKIQSTDRNEPKSQEIFVSTPLPHIILEQEEESNTGTSYGELVEEMTRLKLVEDTSSIFSPDTGSTTSSSCDVSDTSSLLARKIKLNEYLEVCHIQPLGKPMLDWNEITERTQQRYVQITCVRRPEKHLICTVQEI